LENALRRFKRKVQAEDIIKEVKRHSYYLKPGEKETREASVGAQACPEEESPRLGIGCMQSPIVGVTAPFHRRSS
jgi:ribosomal protein S21